MALTPLPGTDPIRLVEALNGCVENAERELAATSTPQEFQSAYLRWVQTSIVALRRRISATQTSQLLDPATARMISSNLITRHELIAIEFETRIERLTNERDQLDSQITRWSSTPGRLIVADTSLMIRHPRRLDEMVLADDLSERETPLRIVLPIVVVDELDSLKQSRGDARPRAQLTLAILDGILHDGIGPAVLREEDYSPLDTGGIPRGRVTVEVLLDPAGHVRMPINDDEVIDRAQSVQAIARRDVTIVTFDTSQATRARAAGLTAAKLRLPREPST